MIQLDEDCGRESENSKPSLFVHKKTGGIYRRVGACIFKGTDEYAILYRKWDDFGNSAESLYCRAYKDFNEHFDKFDYDKIGIMYTEEQAMKKLLGDEQFHKEKLRHIQEERKHFKGSVGSRFKRET